MIKQKRGFTLLEMMFAVGILGLLVSLASYSVVTAHRNALIKQAEGELEMIATATLQMAWDTSRWPNKTLRNQPGSVEIWDISSASVGLTANDGSYTEWKGPYYRGSTTDPWGNPYFFDPDYLINGINHVVIGSFGPNGVGKNVYDDDDVYVLLDD